MPNANGATLTAVRATKTDSPIQEEVLPFNTGFEVTVQAEVGKTLFNGEGSFTIRIVLTNLSTSSIANTAATSGHFGTEWSTLAQEFRFAIPALGGGVEDNVFRAFAVLQTGGGDPIIDFEEGDVFVIARP
jgi:hypothetical protein